MKSSLITPAYRFLALGLALLLSASGFAEPANLSLVKKEVKTYHDSGRYEQELTKAIMEAQDFIIKTAQKEDRNKKLAIVLDIDETSLSNYDKMAKHDFTSSKEQIHAEIQAANSPAIKPMLSLYNDAINHGVKVFFVTGRTENEREATKINLHKAGYSKWAGLYLRPNNYSEKSIIPFKSQTRALIAKKGYTIVASIGDQYSDLRGGYALKGFKLPNPFYHLP